jgi:hypothetical protein
MRERERSSRQTTPSPQSTGEPVESLLDDEIARLEQELKSRS